MNDFCLSFVGVGPQRTGTTWLHEVMSYHPALCLPHNVKETMFFDRYFARGMDWYVEHFAHRRADQHCGEVGSSYFDMEMAPARIYEMNAHCHIIVNLRNPVQLAISLYRHHYTKGRVSATFREAITQMPRIVNAGRYGVHLPRWLDTFDAEQVKFVWLDDVKQAPQVVFQEICDFLNVESIAMPVVGYAKINAGKAARFPWLARSAVQTFYWLRTKRLYEVAKFGKILRIDKLIYSESHSVLPSLDASEQCLLQELYEPDIAFLEDLLKRDLSGWRQIEQEKREP
jgi:hypothetical protein